MLHKQLVGLPRVDRHSKSYEHQVRLEAKRQKLYEQMGGGGDEGEAEA